MKCLSILLILTFPALLSAESSFRWQETEQSIALLNKDQVVWQFNAHKGEMKPNFHPLATIDGVVLSDSGPADHPWHRGLWFCFKLINGVNYWEEDPKTGLSEGRTEVKSVTIRPADDFSAGIGLVLSYHPPGGQDVLTENRRVTISAPDAAGNYNIEWHLDFHVKADIKLDRTPIPGEPGARPYGGYGGMSFRMQPTLNSWQFTNSTKRQGTAVHGKASEWVSFAGNLAGTPRAVTFFDAASNPTYPTKSYLYPSMPFFSVAFLFGKPLEFKQGENFKLSYRLRVNSKQPMEKELSQEAATFQKAAAKNEQ